MHITGTPIIPGTASGRALVSNEPLSFWGGYDPLTGEIIDRRHPLSGEIAVGRVLCLPFSRGSSTTTAILLEAVRAGTAPAAIITTGIDSFFALASVIALDAADFARLRTGQQIEISASGSILVELREVTP